MRRENDRFCDITLLNLYNSQSLKIMDKEQKQIEAHKFATWGANNYETLEEMHKDYLSFSPKAKMGLHDFMLITWKECPSLVDDFRAVKHQEMLERN